MRSAKTVFAFLLGLLVGEVATAQSGAAGLVQRVAEGCQKEIDTHCKAVTPGEGRVFACLYAYSDKLSGRCEYALYEASKELAFVLSKLNYVADSCATDLSKYCADLKPGEGRLVSCLKKNQGKTTPACQQALKDTGMTAK